MEQTGAQLGAYRLYEKIGGGGFATVYVARDTRTNEMVAIKILHPHLVQGTLKMLEHNIFCYAQCNSE